VEARNLLPKDVGRKRLFTLRGPISRKGKGGEAFREFVSREERKTCCLFLRKRPMIFNREKENLKTLVTTDDLLRKNYPGKGNEPPSDTFNRGHNGTSRMEGLKRPVNLSEERYSPMGRPDPLKKIAKRGPPQERRFRIP